jgi:hypothetical protein
MKMFGLAPVLLISVVFGLTAESTFAWTGGPFDNNSTTDATEGTYKGGFTGKNTTGVISFVNDSEGQGGGRVVAYREGVVYVGECDAIIDQVAKRLTGILTGTVSGIADTTDDGDSGILEVELGRNLSGYFNARVDRKGSQVTFKGSGRVAFFSLDYDVFFATALPPDPATTIYALDSEPQAGSSIKIRVKGARTSFNGLLSDSNLTPVSSVGGGSSGTIF